MQHTCVNIMILNFITQDEGFVPPSNTPESVTQIIHATGHHIALKIECSIVKMILFYGPG